MNIKQVLEFFGKELIQLNKDRNRKDIVLWKIVHIDKQIEFVKRVIVYLKVKQQESK